MARRLRKVLGGGMRQVCGKGEGHSGVGLLRGDGHIYILVWGKGVEAG